MSTNVCTENDDRNGVSLRKYGKLHVCSPARMPV